MKRESPRTVTVRDTPGHTIGNTEHILCGTRLGHSLKKDDGQPWYYRHLVQDRAGVEHTAENRARRGSVTHRAPTEQSMWDGTERRGGEGEQIHQWSEQ